MQAERMQKHPTALTKHTINLAQYKLNFYLRMSLGILGSYIVSLHMTWDLHIGLQRHCLRWSRHARCERLLLAVHLPRMLGTKRNRTRVWKLCWDGSTVRLRHMTWEFALNMRYHLHPTRPNRPFEPATSCFLPGIWLKAPSNTSAQGVSLKTASLLLLRS